MLIFPKKEKLNTFEFVLSDKLLIFNNIKNVNQELIKGKKWYFCTFFEEHII